MSSSATTPPLSFEEQWSDLNETNYAGRPAAKSHKVWWKCLAGLGHDDYFQNFQSRERGRGCPKCGYIQRGISRRLLKIKRYGSLAVSHPDIALEWDTVANALTPEEVHQGLKENVVWRCNKCGHQWSTTVQARTKLGTGCPACWTARRKGLTQKPTAKTFAHDYPELAVLWSDKNDRTHHEVKPAAKYKAWWRCEAGTHSDYQRTCQDQTGKLIDSGCPKCNLARVSKAEIALHQWLEDADLKVKAGSRKVIAPYELDLYIPEKQFAIEFNGIYWHSEVHPLGGTGKSREYHYNKWLACKEKGIQLVQIWDDEWRRNPEQVKRMLAHKLGVTLPDEQKVMARKTSVVEVKKQEAEAFLDTHHVQGYASGSHYLGLSVENELVAVLVVRKEPGTGGKVLNIVRYATSAIVPGGFTKLLKHAERTYQPESFITFSDHCVSDGGLYKNNGFIADKELPPDYMYVVGRERKHKFGYRLKRFRDDPALQYQEGMTERELAQLNGLPRIWDAGKTRWVKHL